MQTAFRRRLKYALALPLLVMSMVAIGLFAGVTDLIADLQWVDHTDRVISRARQIQSLLMDTESGMRGYLLSGDPEFLAVYDDANTQLGAVLRQLADDVSDNPDQRPRADQLAARYRVHHALTEKLIAERRDTGRFDPAELTEDHRQMDQMRAIHDDFMNAEQDLRDRRVRRAEIAAQVAYALSIGLTLMLGLLMAFITRRQLIHLAESYDHALRQARSRADDLRESQEWLSTTLHSLAEGVLTTDAGGKIEFLNSAAENLTGWTAREASGKPLAEVLPLHDERTGQAVPDVMAAVRASQAPLTHVHDALLVRRDQTRLAVDYTAAPLRSERQELAGVVVAVRDVSERRRSEEAIRASEKLADTGRLAASIAHEIRSPLEAVLNVLYLLKAGGRLDADALSLVNTANEEAERIAEITQQLLGSYRQPRDKVEVQIGEVIDGVLVLFAQKFASAGVRLETELAPASPIVGFPGEIRQVFTNLVGNAIEATPRGGKVRVRMRPGRDWRNGTRGVRVLVGDTGPGIAPPDRANLFQPFFTTKGEQGTGLGLWVSAGILRKHGGSIRLRSSIRPGRNGTVFSVFLPVEAQAAVPSEAA